MNTGITTSGLGVLLRRYKVPLYINKDTLRALSPSIGKFDPNLINIFTHGKNFKLTILPLNLFRFPMTLKIRLALRLATD